MPVKQSRVAPVKVERATAAPVVTAPAPAGHQGVAPFRTLERLADEVGRIFDDFGVGRVLGRVPGVPGGSELMAWAPRVDVTQHKGHILIRADLPGMEKDDVKINVTEDAVTIHGERHRSQEEERDGVYRSERNYGTFHRTIALPLGTATDQAKASFKNGVLEIRLPAAPGVKGRPLEIRG